ncbi:MAG: SDR family oxidoreductase [Verrucomicrobiota bacterium]
MQSTIIIGGSSGIGFELASELLASGNQVSTACREEGRLGELPGIEYQAFDATQPDAELSLPETLDSLIYCPGTIQLKPFHRLSVEDFQGELEVNFLGAVRVIQQALPTLKKSESASIVLFSTVAVQTGLPFHAGIASAKGAIEGLTRSLAAEFAPKIRVNALALSLTDTPLASSFLSTDERVKASAERHPLKRVGDAAEVARTVKWLIGPDAGFISGQVITMDGGLSSLKLL